MAPATILGYAVKNQFFGLKIRKKAHYSLFLLKKTETTSESKKSP
jgi:hypothetical protein